MSESEIDQWFDWYQSVGLVAFPLYGITNGVCRCPAGAACGSNAGKHPIYKWKNQPSRRPKSTDNIAVSTDPLIVIDLDGDVGEEALAAFPPTFTTTTGHGFHLWYKADPSKNIKSIVGWKHKVDVRAIGGLVVAPPSRHRNGGTYRHHTGAKIRDVPSELLAELPERTPPTRRIGEPAHITVTDTPGPMVAYQQMLVRQMEDWSVSRNQTLFRLGCRFYEMSHIGLLGADALQDLLDAAVRTGLTYEESVKTLESARNSV